MKGLGYILFFFFVIFTSFHSPNIHKDNLVGMMEIYQDTDCHNHQHTTNHCPGSCLCHRCVSPIYHMNCNINLDCYSSSKVQFPVYNSTYTSFNISYIWNPPKYS